MNEVSAFGVIHKAAPKPVDPPEDYIPGAPHKVYGKHPRVKGPESRALTRADRKRTEHGRKKTTGVLLGAATTSALLPLALDSKKPKTKAALGAATAATAAGTVGYGLYQRKKEKKWKKKYDKASAAYEKVLTDKYPHVL